MAFSPSLHFIFFASIPNQVERYSSLTTPAFTVIFPLAAFWWFMHELGPDERERKQMPHEQQPWQPDDLIYHLLDLHPDA